MTSVVKVIVRLSSRSPFDCLYVTINAMSETIPINSPLLKILKPSPPAKIRSEEHTSELQSRGHLVCRLLLDTPIPDFYTISLHDALPICLCSAIKYVN